MPLYEYQCGKCLRKIEKIQSFRDEPLRVCEACGGELERLVSAPAIQFKGSGWYVTDYSRKGVNSSDSKAETKPGAPSEGAKSEAPSATTDSGDGGATAGTSGEKSSDKKSPTPA